MSLLNTTTGHMILGGLIVLFFSPLFSYFGFPWFFSVLSVPLATATIKEIGDCKKWWPHEDSNFKQAMNDVAEWFFGGFIFSVFIALSLRFFSR